MSTVTVTYVHTTFVHTTFVLVSFVNIRNISAVTDPILTKLYGPNIFLGLNLFGPKKNISQVHLDQLFFGTKKFSVLTQKYFLPNFFEPTFIQPKLFQSEILLDPKLLTQILFAYKICLTPFFGSKMFFDHNVLDTIFLDPLFFPFLNFLDHNFFFTQIFWPIFFGSEVFFH